jgi:hypothetical protein
MLGAIPLPASKTRLQSRQACQRPLDLNPERRMIRTVPLTWNKSLKKHAIGCLRRSENWLTV